mmetsp:Transcript_21546/g.3523  ORF Transcript_21546/g.3523 Transcript_21546/m.3523 type:complete len:182 (-) Transcript_21546:343-888(-)
MSFAFGLIGNVLDKRRDRLMGFRGKRTLDPADRVNLRDIKTFDIRFWLISINCVVVYICVMPFNNIASAFYQNRFNFSSITAGWIISITYLISAIFSPFLGLMIDKIGKRVWMIILSAGMMTITHLAFLIMPDCDQCVYSILPLILLGFGYSIYASVIWASIPYVVMPKTVGTAFGLGYAI